MNRFEPMKALFFCSCIALLLAVSTAQSVAEPAPFWVPADQGERLIPQPAPKSIVGRPSSVPKSVFEGYGDRPAPTVPARKQTLDFYPCSQCHAHWKTNPQPRQLAPVHAVGLEHGKGQLWCLDCHDADDRDQLRSLQGSKVDIDQAWQVCGQCHSSRGKDWFFGAHGKRVYNWQGEDKRYNCTHCHNPHRPPFMRRKPQPMPPVRAGLEPMPRHSVEHAAVWEKSVHSPAQAEAVSHD